MISMEQDRKIGLVIFTIVLGIIVGFAVLFAYTTASTVYYWGLLIGVFFGVSMCIYLAEAWDPVGLQPTNPNTSKASWNLLWVVPLGVFAANILADYVSDVVGDLILGCLSSFLIITLAYSVFQAWWHRPK